MGQNILTKKLIHLLLFTFFTLLIQTSAETGDTTTTTTTPIPTAPPHPTSDSDYNQQTTPFARTTTTRLERDTMAERLTQKLVFGRRSVILTEEVLKLCANYNLSLRVRNVTFDRTNMKFTILYRQEGKPPSLEKKGNNSDSSGMCWLYCYSVVPKFSSLSFTITSANQTCVEGNDVTLGYTKQRNMSGMTWTGCLTSLHQFQRFFLTENSPTQIFAGFHVQNYGVMYNIDVLIKLEASTKKFPRFRRFQQIVLTPWMSITQSWMWNIHLKTTLLSNSITNTNQKVPASHQVMCSLLYSDYRQNITLLSIALQQPGGQEVMWMVGHTMPPRVFRALTITLQCKSCEGIYGMRFLFTFHTPPAVPEKVDGNHWNCSVDYWFKFQHHMLCNLITECAGGEDEPEDGCGYLTCPDGGVFFRDACYLFLQPERELSPVEAYAQCRIRGGRIASFPSERVRMQFMDFVSKRSLHPMYVGIRSTISGLPAVYRGKYQWMDSTIAHNDISIRKAHSYPFCGMLVSASKSIQMINCKTKSLPRYVCELNKPHNASVHNYTAPYLTDTRDDQKGIHVPVITSSVNLTTCKKGHVTHSFLACDVLSDCWASDGVSYVSNKDGWDIPSVSACPAVAMTSLPPFFSCDSKVQRVPYTLLCDHRRDCADDSDEEFCVFRPCSVFESQCGSTKQCYPASGTCDGRPDCINHADEAICSHITTTYSTFLLPPATVDIREDHVFRYSRTNPEACPETHFPCPGEQYCLPLVFLCNGVNDCVGHEDEGHCRQRQCPGLFRCRSSPMCLHPRSVCDGVLHCPQWDDEILCHADCPAGCTCLGLAFFCRRNFTVSRYSELRYLHARGSGLTFSDVSLNVMLVHLALSQCGLQEVDSTVLPLLHSLDLSHNFLLRITVKQLSFWRHLRSLSLAGNPLVVEMLGNGNEFQVRHNALLSIDLAGVGMKELDLSVFVSFPNLQTLNMSGCGIKEIFQSGPVKLTNLQSIDLHGSPVHDIPKNVFEGFRQLRQVFADNYKLCCPAVLPPGFDTDQCSAPFSEVSSCDDLLKSDVYRVFLSVFTFLTLIGNCGSFLIRMFVENNALKSSFSVFVVHLCLADFIMGIYLAIIGVADRLYMNSYLWNERTWLQSHICKMAGFLGLLSCEVSAFIICLITLDRFLVLRFPFSTLHFSSHSSQMACCCGWITGLVLAACPLLPVTADWQFYSQTGTCLPLPVTRTDFPGHRFSFGVMIILNFLLFLLIAVGQASIYVSVRASAMPSSKDSNMKARDVSIARRLITVAVTDFLCWFPIGVLGLMAAGGSSIPGEVNVSVAICVLPLNSAVNPFLYTLNLLLEKRAARKERRLLEQLRVLKNEQT